MNREELQRLYDDCRDGRYGHLVALVDGVRRFLADPDPTVEIAYLKAKVADLSDEYHTRWTQGRRPPMSHDDIRAALEAATRQPWVVLYPGQCCEGYCIESEDGRDAVAHGLEGSVSDLDLITSAPTWLAELLAEVDALTARAEAAEQAIQRVRGMAEAWATQPNDYDEDTEQQIEDGKAILRALDGGAS